MNEVTLILKKIIIENSLREITEDDILDNSSLVEDFGFDSFKMIELIVDIETEFNILIEDEDMDIDILTRYGSLRDLIFKKLGYPIQNR